jgi:hypothetical protein
LNSVIQISPVFSKAIHLLDSLSPHTRQIERFVVLTH